MEVWRTVRVELAIPDEGRPDLYATIGQFNDAANYTTSTRGRTPLGVGRRSARPEVRDGEREWVYIPADASSADRESTGKPTTSVVGR